MDTGQGGHQRMFCPACGQANGDQGKFCVGCGHNLAQYQAPAPAVSQPEPILPPKVPVDPFGNPFVAPVPPPAAAPATPEPLASTPTASTPTPPTMEHLISSTPPPPPPPVSSIPVAPPVVFQAPVPAPNKSSGIVGLLIWLLLGIAAGGGGAYLVIHEKAASASAPSH
jgi:hypothetical protein